MKNRNTVLKVSGKVLIYVYALILLVPMYFILVTAFKSGSEINTNPLGFPSALSLSNFTGAFIKGNMLRTSLNSLIIAVGSVALALLNAVVVTYCVNKLMAHRIGGIIYSVLIICMFIPSVAGMVTFLLLMQHLHLYNSIWGIILISGVGGTPINLFMMLGFMHTIPKELEEASYLDGCGDVKSLIYVVVPLLKPALISIGIFTLVGSWNALMPNILLLRDPSKYTIQLGLMVFRGTYTIQYNYMFAAILMSCIPLIIVYLLFQKHFVEALAGGLKG